MSKEFTRNPGSTAERFKLNNRGKVVATLAGGAIGMTLMTGCSGESDNSLHSTEDYRLNDNVTALTLQDEARIRFTPDTGNTYSSSSSHDVEIDTQIAQLSLDSPITVNTDEGVAIGTNFSEGDWYGIPLHDLVANESIAAQIPAEVLEDPNADESIVWVSSQRAVASWDTTQ